MNSAALGMINNAALLLSVGVFYFILPLRPRRQFHWNALLGTIIGLFGIILMLDRWELSPGLFFDTRSILLVISGLFFGTIPTIIAVVITAAFRLWQGGIGAFTGVSVIITSAGLGLFWRHFFPKRRSWLDFYFLGMAVHVCMLGWMLVMPSHMSAYALRQIAVPVLLIYPVATMLLGKLLAFQSFRLSSGEEAEYNERRLRRMLENSWDIIALVDDQGLCFYVSDAVTKTLGYLPSELIGTRFRDLIHPKDVDATISEFRSMRNSSGTRSQEFRLKHKNGNWILTENVITNLLANPEIRAYVINSRDITERSATEQVHKAVLRATLEGFWMNDFEGRILDVNDTLCKSLGYSRDEMLTMNVADFEANESLEEVREHIRNVRKSGGDRFESRLRRKDGSIVEVDVSITATEIAGGRILASFRDSTEHKRVLNILSEERERLNYIIEATDVGTWEWHIPSGKTIFGHRWASMIGYTLEELQPTTYKTWDQFVHPNDLSRAETLLNDHFEHRSDSYEFIGRMRHKDGHWIWVLDRGKVTEWTEDGKPIRMFGTHIDITERMQYEEQLRDSEKHLLQAQEIANAGHYIMDLQQDSWFSSPFLDKILGIDEQFRRDTEGWLSVVHPDDREMMRSYFIGEVIGKGERFDREYRIISIDKHEEKWIHGFGELVVDQNSKPVQLIGLIQDITSTKAAEAEQVRERILLQQITQNSPIGILFVEQNRIITYANPASEKILGLTREEIIARDYTEPQWEHERFDGTPIPEEDLPFSLVTATGQPAFDIQYSIKRRDGSRVYLNFNAVPLKDSEEHLKGIVGFIEDITEKILAQKNKEKYEEELQQAQKMEAVGRLAGGIAHDFNNMLAVIMTTAEMALHKLGPDDELSKDLREIGNAAQRSADLTRQLLAFSRKQIVKPQALVLNDLIARQENMFSRLIGEDIRLTYSFSDESWTVFIDPSQVDQIIANLIVNSRDAISGVGQISISTENVQVDEFDSSFSLTSSPGEFIQLTISDTGGGIDQETIEHIFEPFYTTKGVGEGTGLGLSTVYGIMEQNGGAIKIESVPSSGTTLRLYLPRHRGEPASSVSEHKKSPLEGNETILIVEDEEAIKRLAKRFLEIFGYQALATNSPTEALEIARSHKGEIHLLLTDVVMPEMNGRDLQEKLIELRPGIRTLFMSGYTASIIAQRGVLDQGIEFIPKPFTINMLASAVRKVLDGE